MTVREWFDTVGKDMKISCSTKINLMNDILDIMRVDVYEFKNNIVHKDFSTTGDINIVLDEPIYKVRYWYVKGSACSMKIFRPIAEDCAPCGGEKYNELFMYDVGSDVDLQPCQYYYCRDSKLIKANIPDGITEGLVSYYKYFDRITDLDDTIPIQPSLNPALKMLMKVYYYEMAGTLYQGDELKYQQRYDTFIQKQKDRDALKMRLVEFSKQI
jgi:hypothetical protein